MHARRDRLVLFDIDGTLLATHGAGRRALIDALAVVCDADRDPMESATIDFSGRTDAAIFPAMAEAGGVSLARYTTAEATLHTTYLAELAQRITDRDPPSAVLPGVRELLGALAQRPEVHVGLVTGNLRDGARVKLDAFGLWHYFRWGGFGSDHPERSRIAELARSRAEHDLGISFPAAGVVVVGDTEHDVRCARDNGFRSVTVGTGYGDAAAIRDAAPDVHMDDLADTSAALAALGAG